MKIKLCCIALLLIVVVPVKGDRSLHQHLFNPKRYSSRVRPAATFKNAVNVTFGLALHEIIDLNDKSQQLELRITIRQYWFDSSLSWNKSEFGGIEDIAVHPEKIWIPDIVLYNSAGLGFGDGVMRTQATIRHDGLVRMNIPSILRSTCKVHLANYPFDEQVCIIKFGSWTYDGSQVGLVLESPSADLTSFTPNVEWKLLEIPGEFHSLTYLCCVNPYHDIEYYVKLKRRTLFHAMYLIIPCAVISLLTLLMFLLPPDCSERITVGMAILVALSFFFLLVAENMPATSDTVPIIGMYYSVTLIEVALAFFMTTFVLICHHHNPSHGEPPDWIKKYIKWPARVLGFSYELKQDLKQSVGPQRKNDMNMNAQQVSQGQVNEGYTCSDVAQCAKMPSSISSNKKDTSIKFKERPEDKSKENAEESSVKTKDNDDEKDSNKIFKDHLERKVILERRQEEWQMMALVLNYIFMWIYIIAVVLTTGIILLPQFISSM